MKVDFQTMDVIHRVSVRFVKSFLPGAKKLFHLRTERQPVLDIHEIASKADVYNVPISPRTIEDGLSAGFALINYLVADGYRIKTPLFELGLKFPGEYSGFETAMAEGKYPCARIRISRGFREYLKEKVKPEFNGIHQGNGMIAEVFDEATGTVNKSMTRGNIIVIQGYGLKIETDADHEDDTGVFFNPPSGKPVRALIVPVNEPKRLKVLVPVELQTGAPYTLTVATMSNYKGNGTLLKQLRPITSDLKLPVS